MQNYLLLAAAVLLIALENVIRKRYQQLAGTSITAGFYFNTVLGLTATVLFLIINGFRWESTPFSFIMAFLQAFLAICYTLVGFRIMKESIALYALFLMTGGMIVPYVWGLCFLGEAFSWLRLAGLLLILAAVIFSRGDAVRANPRLILLCVLVFILNGFVSVISKVHQVEATQPVVTAMGFTVLVNFGKLVLSGAAGGVLHLKASPRPAYPPFKKAFPFIFGCTVAGGTSYLLQLTAASHVSASVMYPMITGGSIIFSALMARIFYGEKPTRRQWAGILLCFAGTLMFL